MHLVAAAAMRVVPRRLTHLNGVTHRPSSRPHSSGSSSCRSRPSRPSRPSFAASATSSERAVPEPPPPPAAEPVAAAAGRLLLPALLRLLGGKPWGAGPGWRPSRRQTVGWQGSQGGSWPSGSWQHTNSWTTWSHWGQPAGGGTRRWDQAAGKGPGTPALPAHCPAAGSRHSKLVAVQPLPSRSDSDVVCVCVCARAQCVCLGGGRRESECV